MEISSTTEITPEEMFAPAAFLSIESTGHYSKKCSTCRLDENIAITQVILSGIVILAAASVFVPYFESALTSPSVSSILVTILGVIVMMTSFWFFMPKYRAGYDHQYIRDWAKIPVIGPKLRKSVETSKLEYTKKFLSRNLI